MKTKSLVSTLVSFQMIPLQVEDTGSELLPEAILVKNILLEMYSGSYILCKLTTTLARLPETNISSCRDQTLKTILLKLRKFFTSLCPTQEDLTSSDVFQDPNAKEFMNLSKEILLIVQNDKNAAELLTDLLKDEYEEEESWKPPAWLETLEKFISTAMERLLQPYSAYISEIDMLCSSIALKERFQKTLKKLNENLADIEAEEEEVLREKHEEKIKLEENIKSVRNASATLIKEHMEYVKSRIKVLAWNSHGRQSKILDQLNELKAELENSMEEHVNAETNMRRENKELEAQIRAIIEKYDAEMFQRFETFQQVSKEYAKEKEELEKVLSELEVVGKERDGLLEENRQREQEVLDAELFRIRKIVAAKTIQRSWRAYKTRQLLKSKRKKKKKSSQHKAAAKT